MNYTKDTMPDGTIYETYEGTPREIKELQDNRIALDLYTGRLTIVSGERPKMPQYVSEMMGISEDKELHYDQDDAIDYIRKNLSEDYEAEITKGLLRTILDFEEDYMRSVGIIED